jgi:hypothetical protein
VSKRWKDVTGYEWLYEVSKGGRIRNKKTKKTLYKFWSEDNYLCVVLFKNSQRRKHKLHRLIAIEHVPNPDNKPEVNHLGKKWDLRASMLLWSTRKENLDHMRENGLTRGKDKKTKKKKIMKTQTKGFRHADFDPDPKPVKPTPVVQIFAIMVGIFLLLVALDKLGVIQLVSQP